ncbi:hypothetical protein E1A91_A05G284200v1 [Gossypium mustelinum]|uniref:Uncharacterized protein n=1 Tax=Gossypium mustelinum TaxID=34275 RepID=A0A5D2ZET8_GOSMU|nr:hypothetical protein E1A91_A05G284200v1 [Gossypium mustelinum]
MVPVEIWIPRSCGSSQNIVILCPAYSLVLIIQLLIRQEVIF